MNRLWVRLSLVYVAVIVSVVLLLIVFLYFVPAAPLRPDGLFAANFSAEQLAALNFLAETGVLSRLIRGLFSVQLAGFMLVTLLAGVAASTYASYRLTQPLVDLEEAVEQFGQRDLSKRVAIPRGSEEMISLAHSFNGMAAALESAETRRQNLLADVSHELRTPLTVLQGNLRAALDGVAQLDPAKIAKLYDQTRQLNHLVQDLHDLAQAEANRLTLNQTTVDLAEMVQQIADIFAPLAEEEGIVVRVNSAESLTINADHARLMQVFQNLVANALRYAASEIVLTVRRAGGFATVTISDDGNGISAEHLPHIFDRFYRADDSRSRETGGTGLGLAIVKSIVEAHDGMVDATSQSGQGTTFSVRLLATTPL